MDTPTLALSAASAALRGGIRCVEVALTTPSAPSIIRTLSAEFPSAIIGAGTVLTSSDVAAAASAHAKFALSPVTDVALIKEIHAAGMLAVPGAATPTEIHAAHTAGAWLVKVFPVNLLGGIDFVKAMQGPLGHIPLLPTSGVNEDLLREYLQQPNVACVGASRQILPKDALRQEDWITIEGKARIWAGIAAEYAALRDRQR